MKASSKYIAAIAVIALLASVTLLIPRIPISAVLWVQNFLHISDVESIEGLYFYRQNDWMLMSIKEADKNYELLFGLLYNSYVFSPFGFISWSNGKDSYQENFKFLTYRRHLRPTIITVGKPRQEEIQGLNKFYFTKVNESNKLPECINNFKGFVYKAKYNETNLIYLNDYSLLISTEYPEAICDFNITPVDGELVD